MSEPLSRRYWRRRASDARSKPWSFFASCLAPLASKYATTCKWPQTTAVWQGSWFTATSINFALSGARTDAERYMVQGTDDEVELTMRRSLADLSESRIGDAEQLSLIQGVAAPGGVQCTVLPWPAKKAATFSDAEPQRCERLEMEWRARQRQMGSSERRSSRR